MGESGIRLHPTKGVNAHMTRCVLCGEDGEDLILLGIKDSKFTCNSCGQVHYGFSFMRACQKCQSGSLKKEKIEEHERLPGQCKKCKEAVKVVQEAVEAGGIHVKCLECGMMGALPAHHPTAKAVRKQLKIPKEPCGLELETCEEHTDAVSAKKR